ncbi:MAG: glycosyltransferase [Bacteroidales bacterium]|nr:glycosyltransferase [Bacteroidales bacterium]
MNILSIGPAYPLRGGIADFNETLALSLQDQGHNVHLYSYYLQYPKLLFPGKTQFREGTKPPKLTINNTISSLNPISWYKTAKKIITEKPDFVIIHFWMPFFAPALGTIAKKIKQKNIPVILLCHNVVPHESSKFDFLLTKYITKHCSGFLTLAKSVLEDLKYFTPSQNKQFTPHPIYDIFGEKTSKSDARKILGIDLNKKYILFFGMVRKYKGLDLLLEAMAESNLKQIDVNLIVAGEFYDDPDTYLQLIKKYNLESRVIIHNKFINTDFVKYYFSAVDLVTQTYHTATQSGISQIAYSFDKPMLVTNVGGLSEIVPNEKVGYVVEKDPKQIANAIHDFYINNKEEFFTMNVSIEKKKFQWEAFIIKLLEVVRNTDKKQTL